MAQKSQKRVSWPQKSPLTALKKASWPPKAVPRPQTCPERFLELDIIGWKASIASSSQDKIK